MQVMAAELSRAIKVERPTPKQQELLLAWHRILTDRMEQLNGEGVGDPTRGEGAGEGGVPGLYRSLDDASKRSISRFLFNRWRGEAWIQFKEEGRRAVGGTNVGARPQSRRVAYQRTV